MKKINLFKMLAVLIVLITSINTAWAWSGLHVRSGSYYGGWNYTAEQMTYGDEANKYWDLAHTGGTFYWRLRTDYFNHDVGPYKNNQVMNVGTTGYKVVNTGTNAFATTANAGIIRIQTSQNHDGASDEYPNVWVTRPTVKFKYDFNNDGEASWEMVDATDNNDGTYTYKGLYCGTDFFCAGPNDGDKKAHESGPTTITGSPSAGDRCEFKWNCSGYKYVGNEDQNCGMFYITKLLTITYDANGATKGSVPDAQEVLYNTSSTLATNSGNLEKVGYKFKGWYTNSSGTSGTHYDAGGSITRTSNITLYAEWEAADTWYLKGGNSDSEDGTDALGDWKTKNYFSFSSEHAFAWSVTLAANTTYQFKLCKNNNGTETWYGNNGTISATTPAATLNDGDWTFETTHGNCKLSTGASGAGTYVFTIDGTTDGWPRLRVYFPDDAAKVFLPKNKYIYINSTSGKEWNGGNYVARFWFKATTEDVHASRIECENSNALGESGMYFAKVPDTYVDRVQLNRMDPSNLDGNPWNTSSVKHAYTRSNANQNCLVFPTAAGEWSNNPSWGTYCPPMSSATLAHNDGEHTTTIYGGDGGEDTPYLVATSSSIYVSASSVSALDDDNMTPYYQFKKAGSNDGEESSTATHTYTASGTNNTKQAMTVVARNYYYTTDAFYGTASPTSNSIYYESRTPYSVDVRGLTHMTVASGRTGSAAIVHGVEYVATLDSTVGYNRPTSVTVTCAGSDISANCTWVKASGVLTIPAAYVTGDIAITATGVAKTYTTSNNLKNPDNTTAGTYQVTYDATSIVFVGDAPTKTGYDIERFYATNTAGVLSNEIANGDRSLVSSTTSYTSGGQWKYDDGAPTLYINWTAHEYSITYKDKGDETFTGNNSGSLPTTHTYSSPTELVNATKTGYRFDGWYADAACTSRVYSLGATTYTDDITLYAKWTLIVSSDNTNFEGYTTPSTNNDVLVTNGATLTISTNKTVQDITVETGSTLNVAKGASGITFTVNSLSLVGGWGTVGGDTKYDMPRVYIDPASTLSKAVSTVNLDVAIDNDNYYPIAVPFPVDVKDVDYADVYLAGLSTYGFSGQYAIKKYNGQQRADRGSNYANWEIMNDGISVGYGSGTETLEPGHGYIVTALPTTYETYATIRFPMTVDDAWTTKGEQGSATISAETITKNEVDVFDYHKEEGETPKNHKGWNLLGVPFMSCYASSSFDEDPDGAYIKGKLNFSTGAYTDETHVYVSVPTYDFSEYIQSTIDEAVLLPGWCFFVQFDEGGTLTFKTAGESVSAPFRATKYDQSMPTVKTGIILSGAEASDKTTILVSDKYSASEYEINADLEKLFGENSYTLATYSLSGETRLAYNAMSNADATQMIPIGYRAPEAGEYTFSINPRYADGAFGGVNLIDYETNTVTDLLQSSYTFSTERTQNDARFALNVVPAPAVITAIENDADGTNNGARKILLDGKMYIILNGQMYDATGALVK